MPVDEPGREKYRAIKGSVPALLGSDEVEPGDVVIGLEGEFDRWLCWQEMRRGPAAVSRREGVHERRGATHRLDRYWLWKLSRSSRLVWVLDNDEAGQRAAAASRAMGSQPADVRVSARWLQGSDGDGGVGR